MQDDIYVLYHDQSASYDDEPKIAPLDDCEPGAHPFSLSTSSMHRRTWLALGEANTLPHTAAVRRSSKFHIL